LEPQPDGTVTLDLNKIDRDAFAAVSQLDVETCMDITPGGTAVYGRIRSTRLKFHDKMAALTCLAKIQQLINAGSTTYVQNNTIYQSAAWQELQQLQQHELQEFEEFKKSRGKVLQAAPPKDKE
jgi:hypothetical protein